MILIAGGSGFIGKHLAQLLIDNGYLVSILSRNKKENTNDISYYQWDVEKGVIDEKAVLEADSIINLAGENIAEKRWTLERKQAIVQSRVGAIELIYSVLQKHNKKLDSFISASGIGIYGVLQSNIILTEDSPLADDFLGDTCQKWESAADLISNLNIRTVKIRTGLVIGPNDGFLKKLIPIFRLKLGTPIGTGEQFMSWIHVHDLCEIYIAAIENQKINGAYNAVIKDGTTNYIFSKKLAKVYGYNMWLPNVPTFIIQILMGEMADIVLTGQRVSSDKIEKTGFVFKFTKLSYALRDCLKNKN
ncbi:TIGR01777 family oxidoreductase [Flavobacterium sp.]|uniref:TIGR01777 family oxidoreductase n=1 Tax=Flavobacterium sp. TaxID=239 RepID=UPI0038FD1ABD